VKLSVCIITLNEEANIGRTLKSVQPLVLQKDDADGPWGEIIVVDSGSTDKTVEIAKSFGAKVFTEPWKGFAAQKNSAIEKAQGEWIFSLDADEEVSPGLVLELSTFLNAASFECQDKKGKKIICNSNKNEARHFTELSDNHLLMPVPDVMALETDLFPVFGMYIPRKNFFIDKWARRGGFFPDRKLRLFFRGKAQFEDREVHETALLKAGGACSFQSPILHHAYPTLSGYIEHMNKYSSLAAEMEIEKGRKGFSLINILVRPWLTFIYNYIFRLGFLDGKEGLLLHMYHAVYVSWKYAKVWELSRASKG